MVRITRSNSTILVAAALAFAVLALTPGLARAADAGGAAAEIKALIMANSQYGHDHLMDQAGGVSKDGSLEFWSSGGLMNWVAADAAPSEYDWYSLTPKHITVIELPGGQAAVAMYYSEGSFQPKGTTGVSHYMTRATEVYVKENGAWVVRAAHWSPIAAGSGTNQVAVN